MSDWFIAFLHLYIGTHHGSRVEAAREFGCTPAFVHGVLTGRKRPPDSWLAKFHLRRVVRYEAAP